MLIPVLLVCAVLILLVVFLRRNYGTLEKCGFPVIPPTFCLGSGPFMYHKMNLMNLDIERFEKYGNIYGAYIISSPWVFISDPDIIKQITIKDFDHFPGHQFVFPEQKYRTLDSAVGEEWKELRKGLSPIFTSGKIKGMMKLVDGAIANMLDHLSERVKEDPVIDMKPMFQSMTMDVIAKCAFGIDLNCFKDPDNLLFVKSKQIFQEFMAKDLKSSIMANLELGMTGFEKYVISIPDGWAYVWNITKKIQTDRAKENVEYGDFIDKLSELKHITKNGLITEDQLTAQGIIFMIAGFETTANTLGGLSYHLAKNPEAYERLMEEVNDIIDRHDGVINYETVMNMPYLEACVKESLRLSPPVARNDRMCSKDWEYKGIKIKKGTSIGIPTYVVHHNPEYWPEPEMFKPERFLKENAGNIVPCSFLPFGSGPRACIGERFALTEIKIALTRLLQKFDLQTTEKTRLKLVDGDLFLFNYADMYLKLVPRN